jgi:nicotinamidase-related amidase
MPNNMKIDRKDALIVVDVQNDFLPGGTLAVPDGDRVIEPINRISSLFCYVVATRDWHPREHPHFEPHGGPWPYHCIQETEGAAFARQLDTTRFHKIVSKGMHANSHGYSGFDGTQLERLLRGRGIRRVFVCGLATDYCVKSTAVDAAKRGFETILLTDAAAAVNLDPSDEADALREMAAAGVVFSTSAQLQAGVTRKRA